MKRMIQHNSKFITDFISLTQPFLDWRGRFSAKKYHKFFIEGSIKKIEQFYGEAQQFINKLVTHVHTQENGRNQWSRYFVDLTILLASNMDTSFRAQALDNKRTNIDVTSFSLESILEEIECVRTEATNSNPKLCFISVPVDFSLLYNVGDMLTVGFDTNNRKFIYPKLIEVKDHKQNYAVYKQDTEKQIKRETKQALRFADLYGKYDIFNGINKLFYGYPTYLSRRIVRKLIRKSRTIIIDEMFSVKSSMDILKHDDDFWRLDMIEEITCGNIIPMVFKDFNMKWFNKIMENGIHLYIIVNKNAFMDSMRKLGFIDKIDKHPSPYHAFIDFGYIKISIANLIHMKYSMQYLKDILQLINVAHRQIIEEQKNAKSSSFLFRSTVIAKTTTNKN